MSDKKEACTLYTAGTPNGWKASIVLEELGIPYNLHKISLSKLEQKQDWFLKINPNGRIPALVDHDNNDMPIFESGAIMLYLCDRFDTEGRLLPKEMKERYEVIEWLMFQMGGLGPMQGQANHFVRYAPEQIEYAKNRYKNETKRLYGVLNDRLKESEWLAAGKYTLADIANFSWVAISLWAGVDVSEFPKLQEWVTRIEKMDAVRRGMDVPDPFAPFQEKMRNPEAAEKAVEAARSMMVSTKPN